MRLCLKIQAFKYVLWKLGLADADEMDSKYWRDRRLREINPEYEMAKVYHA